MEIFWTNRTTMFVLAGSYASYKQFPDNFLLGTATGAYQVEGAWDEGKFICIIKCCRYYILHWQKTLISVIYKIKLVIKYYYTCIEK